MSSVSHGYRSGAHSRRTHTRWTDFGERIEVIDLGFNDSKESGPSFPRNNDETAIAEQGRHVLFRLQDPHGSPTPSMKPVSHSAVSVTPSDLGVRVGNAGTPSTNSGTTGVSNRRSSSGNHVGVNAVNVTPPHSFMRVRAPPTSALDAHAQNGTSPPAKVRKVSVANPYTSETKSVGSRTVNAPSPISDIYGVANDKVFEAALAVRDPYGEARLDFPSSAAYYASRVYEARAGTPASEWTQDAYLPASVQGANKPKGRVKRRIGMISSFAPTFNPAPNDDLFRV